MGSISTVSSQTFKTYCFMAEKEGWREGEERWRTRNEREGPGVWRSCWDGKRRRKSNAYGEVEMEGRAEY